MSIKKIKKINNRFLAMLLIVVFFISPLLSILPTFGINNIKKAEAFYPEVKVIFLTTTGTNTWTVPDDWSDNNKIEVIGAGGGGRTGGSAGSKGGGGGAYSVANVTGLSSGGSVTYRVGTGGTPGVTGGDTFFNRTAGSANTCADTVSVCAKGGGGGTSVSAGGAGGLASGNKPANVGFNGGTGGNGSNTGDTGGGGGGAAGPNGFGMGGGAGQGAAPGAGGGGGASNGGSAGAAGSTNGGNGGANFRGAAGGTGANATTNTAAVAGNNGAGGGGGAATTTVTALRAGANGGGNGGVWTSTHAEDGTTPSVVAAGPGGGGGGAGATTANGTNSTGGNGGGYGGGGGGAYTTAGTGGQGLIVITYVPDTVTNIKTIFLTTTGTQTWTVPADWSDNNEIMVLGGGGGGRVGGASGSGGGGGGAFATSTVTGLSPSASITYRVGTGGAAGTAGGDTFFNRTAGAANTCADTVSVCAKGGSGASSATGGAGGVIANNKPAYSGYRGGAGGNGNTTGDTGGGGGGAAGPYGAGQVGGAGQGAAPGAGGGGAGAAGAGAIGATTGGAGGVSFNGNSNGTGASPVTNTAATAGTNGGGGGGGAATTTTTSLRAGANGSSSTIFTSTHDEDGTTPEVVSIGPGGGGGGAGATTSNGTGSTGGNGGYGAGGGGAYTTAGIGGQGFIIIRYVPSGDTTTLGDGTDPGNSTIAPGASVTDLGQFSLVTSSGSDTVTALTVTLSPANSFNNIAKVEITDTSNVDECTDIDDPASLTLNFTGCSLAVTTGSTEFKIRITPKTHANMPAPASGASYAVTGTVTAITATNSTAGTDTNGATITIDNASPAVVTAATVTAGDTQANLAWTNPADADVTTGGTIVVLRRATSAVADVPVEGTTYTVGNTIGTATVACVVTGSPPATSCTDTGLTNGTVYHYEIFSQDSRGNYDATGVVPTGSPVTPVAPISISGICVQVDGVTPCVDDGSDSIKFAINGSIQAGTDTTVDGSWSITGITPPSAGAIITVFVDAVADANEASAVIEYDGTGDITGVELIETGLTIGSGSDSTVVSNADIGQYDGDNDEDLTFTSNAGVLAAGAIGVFVSGVSTYTPGGAVTAYTFYSDSGTTNAGSASWTLTDFILAGGTFTSTSGTMRLYGNFTRSSGTFNDGGGTVEFGSSNGSPDASLLITGNTTFNNLTFSDGLTENCCSSDVFTIEAATTVTVNGTLTIDDPGGETASLNTGTIHAKGDISVSTVGLMGSALIVLNKGSATQTITGAGSTSYLPNVELAGGGSGTIALSGTIRPTADWTYTSGTISPGSSTVIFGSNDIVDQSPTITGSHTLNNITFLDGRTNNCCDADEIIISSGTTITASGNVSINDTGGAELDISGGTIDIKGNLTVTGNNIFGNASTTFSGAGNTQTITTGGFTIPTGVFTINKSSGSAVLAGNLILGTSQPVNITSGTFDQGATYNFRAGAVTVGASGVWTNTGTGDVTLGGNVSNAGTITLDSAGNGCGDADGITLTSTASAQRTWSGAGTFQLYDLAVSWMAGTMTTTSSTNNGNNTNWTFSTCGGGTITVSGNLYGTNGSTPIDCSTGGNRTVRVKVNGAGAYSADCTLNTGAYSVGSITVAGAGDVVTVFLDDETENANLVTLSADGSSSITGANLYQNHLIVRSESASAVTNTNLNQYDANTGNCAGGTGEDDMLFCVTSGELTVLDGAKLLVWTGDTFTPGGVASTSPSSNSSTLDGDVEIQASATLNVGTNALSIGGDFINAGTFTESGSPQVTTFTATASGHSIDNGTGNFDKIIFNGSGGGWSFTDASNTIADDLTVTAGTLSGTNSVTVNGGDVTGNGTISITGGTFTLDGTGSFGGDTGWTFGNLVLGNGSGAETTTGTGTGSITASTTSISTNQTFVGGSKTLNISGASYFSADTVAVVDTGSAQAGVTNTVSLTNLDISGTNKVVYIHVGIRGLDNAPTVSSVTVGGVAAELVTVSTTNSTTRSELWRLIAPANGTGVTVTANLSGNATSAILLGAISLSGVDQTDPDEAVNSQAGTLNTLSSTNITTLTNNALITDFVFHRNDADIAEGANQTNRLEHTNSVTTQAISTKPKAVAGQASMAWTNGANHEWNHIVVSVKPYVTGLTNPFVITGTFTPSSGTVQYSGINTTHVATSTYNSLTLGGTGTYRLPYEGLVLTGNLTIADGATVVEPAGGEVVFAGGTTQTVLDYNNSLKQDIGDVRVASSGYGNSWCAISSTSCNTSWGARKKIIFNNASSTALTNFPVLVTLNSGSINYSKTQNSGQDIRFVDADGTTILSHEIETWNESATSTVWVKVPQIDANSVTDYIWMYYDNSGASDGQDATNVWDANYVSVWHMGESASCPTTINDSTGTNDTSCTGSPAAITGKVNGARDFNGSDQYFDIASGSNLALSASGAYTWSTWVNSDSLTASGGWPVLVNQSDDGADAEGFVLHAHTLTHASLPGGSTTNGISAYWDNTAASIVTEAENVVTTGNWYHITVTYDGSLSQAQRFKIYVNAKDVTGSTSSSGTIGDVSPNNIRLAGSIRWSGDKFDGKLDDFRFSDTLRSADWIRAEYRTMNNEMNVFTPEETQISNSPAWCDIGTSCTSSWLSRRAIYINNASSTLSNFPIMVSLNSNNIDYTKTQNAGQDIRFVDADGTTILSHEIETWNESATSTVWVKVPTLSNTNSDYVWMYYDNSGASDGQDAGNVWDSNFKAIYHLPDGSSLSANDATSNNVDGTITDATASVGVAGAGSASLNGTTAFINLAQPGALTSITGSMTISGWVNADTLGSRAIVSQQGLGGARGYHFATNGSGVPYFELASNSTTLFSRLSGVTLTAGKWYYVTGVYNASTQTLNMYIDGVLSNGTLTGTVSASQYIPANDVNIGRRPVNDEYWDGLLDEIRISNAVRSAEWIQAENRSVRNEMLGFGPVEAYSAGDTPTTLNLSSTVRVSDVTIDTLNTLSLNGNNSLVVSGNDFTNNGTFDGSTGTFIAVPNITETPFLIRGSSPTTFNNFTANKPLTMLRFKAGQTVTIAGTMNISGAEGRPVLIGSETPNSQWTLYLTGSGSVNHVVVKDSACHASSNLVVVDFLNNQGNNGVCLVAIAKGSVGALDNSGGGSGVTGGGFGGGGGGGFGGGLDDGGIGGGGTGITVATSPAIVNLTYAGTGNASGQTSAFTPANNSLLVVYGSGDTFNATPSLSVSGGGLTWTTRVTRGRSESGGEGFAFIATAPVTTGASMTVTVTLTGTGLNSASDRGAFKVDVVTGYDVNNPVDSIGANNEGSSALNSFNTTSLTPGANGLLFVSAGDWNALGAPTSSNLTTTGRTYHHSGFYSGLNGYRTVSSGVSVNANVDAPGSLDADWEWVQMIVRGGSTPQTGGSEGGGGGSASP